MRHIALTAVAATAALSGSAFLYKSLSSSEATEEVSVLRDIYEKYLETFNKNYTPDEKARRFAIFVENVKAIEFENLDADGIVAGMNQFTDMSAEEFKSTLTFSFPINEKELDFDSEDVTSFSNVDVNYPRSYPATEEDKKCTYEARDQGYCGSCWAFATAHVAEIAHCKATGEKHVLSPQHLVDCDKAQHGCQGASTLTEPFEFVQKDGGLCLESDYKYKGRDGVCNSSKCGTRVSSVSGVQDFSNQGADKLAEMIAKYGAISVGVDGSAIQHYRGGVMTRAKCRASQLNHAVTAVGYEVDENGTGYFLIKNSWGATWGDHGHIKMEYGACYLGAMLVAPEIDGL